MPVERHSLGQPNKTVSSHDPFAYFLASTLGSCVVAAAEVGPITREAKRRSFWRNILAVISTKTGDERRDGDFVIREKEKEGGRERGARWSSKIEQRREGD